MSTPALKPRRTPSLQWLRRTLELLGLLVMWPALGAPECPKVGAIRWDAWYGGKDYVGRAVEESLGPERWHSRLPFCAEVLSKTEVRIDCASQAVMDREIEYARVAGIDYWAFVAFAPDRLLSAGLDLYLSSEKRGLINFALLTGNEFFGGPGEFERVRDRFVSLMKQRGYQTVLDGRPLLYVGFIKEAHVKENWKTYERLREAFQGLRDKALAEGLRNPYLVLMDFNPARAEMLRQRLGFDAVSSYAPHRNALRGSYKQLTAHAKGFWEGARKRGSKVVPTVMAGWDDRPRMETLTGPWAGRVVRPGDTERYYQAPSPQELAEHVGEAVNWIWSHPSAAEANTVIAYAWNEFDEGGWIAPTLGEGDARVRAIGERMRALRAAGSEKACQ